MKQRFARLTFVSCDEFRESSSARSTKKWKDQQVTNPENTQFFLKCNVKETAEIHELVVDFKGK